MAAGIYCGKWVFMLGEKLSVGEIFAASVGHTLTHFRQALKVSLPWLITAFAVISLLIGATGITATPDGAINVPDAGMGTVLLVLVSIFVIIVVASACAVSWHRFVIDEEPPPFLPQLDRRAFTYAGYVAAIIFTAIIMVLMLGTVAGIIIGPLNSTGAVMVAAVVLYLIVALAIGRLTLALPATAMDDTTLTLAESWRYTAGNTWSIFLCLLLTGLVTAIPEWVMSYLVQALPILALPSVLVSFLLSALSFTIGVGTISHIYLALTRDIGDSTPPAY